MAKFRAVSPEGQVLADVEITDFPCTIGRDLTNSIVITHTSISRRHAIIEYVGGSYVLRDVGSSNGTWINGNRVVEIDCGLVPEFKLGSVEILFESHGQESFHTPSAMDVKTRVASLQDLAMPAPTAPSRAQGSLSRVQEIQVPDFDQPAPQTQTRTKKKKRRPSSDVAAASEPPREEAPPAEKPRKKRARAPEREAPPREEFTHEEPERRYAASEPAAHGRAVETFWDRYDPALWCERFAHRLKAVHLVFLPVVLVLMFGIFVLDAGIGFASVETVGFAFGLCGISFLVMVPFMLFSKIHSGFYRARHFYLLMLAYLSFASVYSRLFEVLRFNFTAVAKLQPLLSALEGLTLFVLFWGIGSILFHPALRRRVLFTAGAFAGLFTVISFIRSNPASGSLTGFVANGKVAPLLRDISPETAPVTLILDDLDNSLRKIDQTRSPASSKGE